MTGWIGVDLDGTLAFYEGWVDQDVIGAPIPLMVARVQEWLREGREVRIFTARVAPPCSDVDMAVRLTAINLWCAEHIGCLLPVTCVKDLGMLELWDDRCVRVMPNRGVTCCDYAYQKILHPTPPKKKPFAVPLKDRK